MKITDVPKQAFNAEPTPIPMKSVPDWDALYSVLMDEAFIVLEADELRISKNGSQEAVNVKNFNNYVRITKRRQLLTKRISDTRWVCMLKPEGDNPYLFNPHTLTPRVVGLLHRQSQYLKQEDRDAIALRLAALNTEGE